MARLNFETGGLDVLLLVSPDDETVVILTDVGKKGSVLVTWRELCAIRQRVWQHAHELGTADSLRQEAP